MSLRRNLLVSAALVATLPAALQGCSTTPRFNASFGDAVRANMAAQLLDPGAARNANPATGMDGVSARAAHERYQRSFSEKTAPPPTLIVGAGGGDR